MRNVEEGKNGWMNWPAPQMRNELFLLFIYLKLTNKKKMNRSHAT